MRKQEHSKNEAINTGKRVASPSMAQFLCCCAETLPRTTAESCGNIPLPGK
jgi:hypothetical protein